MLGIIFSNFGLWINLLIPFLIGAYLIFNDREYSIKEFCIQMSATLIVLIISFYTLFSLTTDLEDTEYWNGRVKSFEYFEKWTEEITYTETYSCGSSKSPQTCTRLVTRHDYHSPYWVINTTNSEVINIHEAEFKTSSAKFGQSKVVLNRSGQVSYGDGNKFVVQPNVIIPTSVEHSYINYVVAAKHNVVNVKSSKAEIDLLVKNGDLVSYPGLGYNQFGNPILKRVINTSGVKIPQEYLEKLSELAAIYGASKQVNPILYITKETEGFKYNLEAYWNNGKKNDCTLIIGIDSDGKVKWSDVIAWTDNAWLFTNAKNITGNINEMDSILTQFTSLITKDYKRKSMKDFEYLSENIELNWYWQLLVILINIVLSAFLFIKFRSN